MSDAPPPTRQSEVTLELIGADDLRSVIDLKVAEHQRAYVADNAVSLAQAGYGGRSWQRAIHAGGVPVGYALVHLGGTADPRPYLWRFMIDARFQGLGFGTRALGLITERVRRMKGACTFILGTSPGEHTPRPFYERLGFEATGEIDEGEVILALELPALPPASATSSGAAAGAAGAAGEAAGAAAGASAGTSATASAGDGPPPGSDFYCERVLSGDVHVRVVEQTDDVLAFHHTRPHWPVHIVVIPRRHVPSLTDLGATDEALLHGLLAVVRRVAAQVEADHGAARVLTNLGAYQDSKHLHWHVCSGDPADVVRS